MKFKLFIKRIFKGLSVGVSRFLYAFFAAVALWGVISVDIINEDLSELTTALSFGLVFGLLLSVLIILIVERTRFEKRGLWFSLTSIIPSAICAYIVYRMGFDNKYLQMGYFGLITSFVSLILFILCRGNKRENIIGYLLKSLLVSFAISGILCGGFSTSIAAADFLIFKFKDIYKVYSIVNLFILIVVGINLFLSYIPRKEDEITLPKIFKVLVLYVALPVYLLLISILYIYFIKILVTWNLPSGEINWFASFASLFFVFFLFCLRPYTEKIAMLFKKYAPYFIIPVIAVQTLAIVIRINAYGFTTPRFISVVLVFISLLFALFEILGKKSEKVFLKIAIIAIIICLTPINVIDIPKANQVNRLHNALLRNDMLNDERDTIIPNPNVNEDDKQIIIGSYSYLLYVAGEKPAYIDSKKNYSYDYKKLFGFEEEMEGKNIYVHYSSNIDYDISEYSYIKKVDINYDKSQTVKTIDFYDGTKYEIDIVSIIKEIYDEHGTNSEELPVIELDENHALIVNHLSADYNEMQEINYYYLEGYILKK